MEPQSTRNKSPNTNSTLKLASHKTMSRLTVAATLSNDVFCPHLRANSEATCLLRFGLRRKASRHPERLVDWQLRQCSTRVETTTCPCITWEIPYISYGISKSCCRSQSNRVPIQYHSMDQCKADSIRRCTSSELFWTKIGPCVGD